MRQKIKGSDNLANKDHLYRDLMLAAQKGDSVAYTQLLKEITPLVRRYVRWHQSRWSLAEIEDVVQDVLVSIHLSRATYDSKRPFRPWLLAIARNRIADARRRLSRRIANEIATDRLPETFSQADPNPSGEMCAEIQFMRRAIEDLSNRQRRAIELLKLQGLSLKEASAMTGMSVAALKVTVHRAMKSLRASLGQEMP